MGNRTIVINGKVYDATTGLPVAAPTPTSSKTTGQRITVKTTPKATPPKAPVATARPTAVRQKSRYAATAHQTTQKSKTLRRDLLKKPTPTRVDPMRRRPQTNHVSRSQAISKFAPHPQPIKTVTAQPQRKPAATPAKTAHIVAQKQALVQKKTAPKQAVRPQLSSRALKEQLISERLAAVDTTPAKPIKAPRKSLFAKQPRAINVLAASLAVMVFGGYLTYLNMPGLSVRVAASQADVAASFPNYHPDGYRFDGPVAYAPGQVTIKFSANGGPGKYTITEQKSSWDSQAVYDNIVAVNATNDNYTANSQQGLTIYTYNGEAAWVNKGILYTVNGDAPLSDEQLLKIAASL